MPAGGGAARYQARHVGAQSGHVKRPMFHPYINIVRPRLGVLGSLLVGQDMTGMSTDIVPKFRTKFGGFYFRKIAVT